MGPHGNVTASDTIRRVDRRLFASTLAVMTTDDSAQATRLLAKRDPVLGAIIRQHGACGLARDQRTDPFAALIEAIAWQQLSTKAAARIFERFLALFPDSSALTPADLVALPDSRLRTVGLSGQKIGYLRDLCEKVSDGRLRFDSLERMSDDDVIAALTQVKGIGRWSAEMFLMFRLHRLDVLPVGDLGIVRAIQKAYHLRKPPAPKRMLELGQAWRPYRSIAAWYLWASIERAPLNRG